ncbi:MAG TPA: tetratricopeptide repeat protein [Syntrophobacteraceae bacterium]|nr:tetratricopeptide repeat protein [Syntrophobacteraceae bacterium]
MRALVVEDHNQMRMMVRGMLEETKRFELVDEAADGERGWERILDLWTHSSDVYDLVVCDVNMPVLGGLELLKRCRSRAEFRFLPFIMISTAPSESTIAQALGEYGANDFLVKPLCSKLFEQRVLLVLSRAQSPEEVLYRRAESLKESDAVREALELIESWEKENRFSLAKWFNLKGECLFKAGDPDKAALEFQKATQLCEIYVAAYKNYASAQQKLGNTEKVIEALAHIEAISPSDDSRTLLLGELLFKAGRPEEGKRYLENLLKRSNRNEKDKIVRKTAQLYLDAGLYQEAEGLFKMTLKSPLADVETYNQLGIALRQQGKFEEAERCYLTALNTYPRHAGIYHNLGVLHMARRDYSKARRSFQKALIFNPHLQESKDMIEKIELLDREPT